jgi:hypothetical protein
VFHVGTGLEYLIATEGETSEKEFVGDKTGKERWSDSADGNDDLLEKKEKEFQGGLVRSFGILRHG